NLVNLVGELELRLTGSSAAAPLPEPLGAFIPQAASYLMVLFDGLGDRQLAYPAAQGLAESRIGELRAPFPTTTTVSLATVASGQPVSTHGWLAHLMWFPELNRVVNTLKWVDLGGAGVNFDTSHMLPNPNLWERLGMAGVEAITVQPTEFAATPLTAALYRGAQYEGYQTAEDFVARSLAAVAVPGRLVFAYWPPIDFAAHVFGLSSPEYEATLWEAAALWRSLKSGMPPNATMIATADHGMVDVPAVGKYLIRDESMRMLDFWGDSRALMIRGSRRLINRLREESGAELMEAEEVMSLFGGAPHHPQLEYRRPDAVLLAPPNSVLLPPGFDKRLLGYHGGLTEEETAIPLLVEA
ncbi:MAG TPA: alkaline phosphatase family protein, partial [Acidimicrobiia bacterium]|nr:alkaline phosphatase family protein [Acidimicrobiia bacterium]